MPLFNIDSLIIENVDTIDSTNDYLKSFSKSNIPRICRAEHQLNGRGRLNTSWHSPPNLNLYFSCLYPFQLNANKLSGLSLLVGLAIIKSLNQYSLPFPALVKWPNDILCNHHKLCGILIELEARPDKNCNAIIGIGINVNMHSSEEHPISKAWTSLRLLLNTPVDREQLFNHIIRNLFFYLESFEKFGFEYFLSEWETVDYLKNKKITLQEQQHMITGIAQGIDIHGNLLLSLADGTTRSFSSAEVKNVS